MINKKFKFFLWSISGVFSLLVILLMVGNFIAVRQEQKINKEIDEFITSLPQDSLNDSSIKLAKLASNLGISFLEGGSSLESQYMSLNTKVKTTHTADYGKVREKISKYLDKELSKPNDKIAVIPKELSEYLELNASSIDAIIEHLNKNDVPNLGIDEAWVESLRTGDSSYVYPAYLGIVDLQRLIVLNILYKHQNPKEKAVTKDLEASWKLLQSFRNSPMLIAQLVSIISGKYYSGVIRKLDNLPSQWQERAIVYDYRQSINISVESEFILQFKFLTVALQEINLSNSRAFKSAIGIDSISQLAFGGSLVLHDYLPDWLFLSPMSKIYLKFSGLDTYPKATQNLKLNQQQNICWSTSSSANLNVHPAWWNFVGKSYISSWLNQTNKASKYMLNLELTQKILKIKEIAYQQGSFPETPIKMDSTICPNTQWIYQVSPTGEKSISLSHLPEWLKEDSQKEGNLPLVYYFE